MHIQPEIPDTPPALSPAEAPENWSNARWLEWAWIQA